MKYFYSNISILFVTFLLIDACDPADNRLKIFNDSNADIYFIYSCDSALKNIHIFRNGYYSNSLGDSTYVISSGFVKKKSNKKNLMRLGFNAWVHYVKDCPNKELNFYFFMDSIVSKYSDEKIIDKKLFEKHIIVSLKDLKHSNWTIRYP